MSSVESDYQPFLQSQHFHTVSKNGLYIAKDIKKLRNSMGLLNETKTFVTLWSWGSTNMLFIFNEHYRKLPDSSSSLFVHHLL